MSHYTNHSISVQDTSDSAAVIVGSLVNASLPIDQEVQANATGGRYYPEQISVVSQKPRMSFTSYDIPKLVTAFGLIGRKLTEASGTKPGIALYQAKYNDNALVSGSNHRRLRFPLSYNHISKISCSHRQDATAEAMSIALADGTNNPVVIEASQALPTLPATSGRWTLGAITIGAYLLTCNVQLDIDFGITVEQFGCNSDIWDNHLNLDSIQPKISITALDVEGFAAAGVPLVGLVGTHANTAIYLRKRAARGASFVANGTAEHIKITASGILLMTEAHNGQANQKAQSQLQMHCDYDGTNAPIVLDTASAIS